MTDKTVTRTVGARAGDVREPARLRVVHPPELAAELSLDAPRTVLGRSPEGAATGVVRHPTVSRSHLVVEWDPVVRALIASDLGSHNGSAVDGAALPRGESKPLRDGSVVRLGQVLAVLEAGRKLAAADAAAVSRDALPGEAAAMRLLRGAVARAARDPSPVLVIGETGTGKEYVAEELHRLSGRSGKLVTVNCAALSPHLVESQLFGHARGAFTGATEAQPGLFRAASGGTLFLDEIGELPADLQPKLLRAIQSGEVHAVGSPQAVRVDVRVVAATNRDLAAEVERGAFRRDLYARLALWELRVPALRERRADLLGWLHRLHRRWLEARPGVASAPLAFDAEAAEALLLHPWPDNLRGLDRLVHELAAARPGAEPIGLAGLPKWMARLPTPRPAAAATAVTVPIPKPAPPTRDELEAVLASTGSVRGAAKHFGRDRKQIYRWIEMFGIKRPTGDD